MKPILDLTRAISNSDYFVNQFTKMGDEKNILFINPQLSGKCLYKMILPFFSLYSEKIATAISGLRKYDYETQLLGGDEIILDEQMIEWADFIVFPFTTQPLVAEYYEKIRNTNQECKIIFLIDFNFYNLRETHPYKKVFNEPMVLSAMEDNIWFADICLTSNALLVDYLVEKFQGLGKTKYANTPSYLNIACMPYMIDTDIVLKNVEFDPMKPILVNPNEHSTETKSHIDEVAKTAEVMKEADLAEKQRKLEEEAKELEVEVIIDEEMTNQVFEPELPEPNFEMGKLEVDNEKLNNTKENGNSKSKPTAKSATKPNGKLASKSEGKPTSKPATKPTVKSATKPSTKPASKSTGRPTSKKGGKTK